MAQDSNYQTPHETIADHGHSLVRAGIGSIPVVGSAAVELFQSIVTPPLERRRQQWMEEVALGLRKVEEKQGCIIEDLSSNDAFIDTVMSASQAAIRTSQEEKRKALKNAVLNAALPNAPDESRQQLFVNLIDSMSPWHIRILRFFSDPVKVFRELGKQPPEYGIGSSLSQILTTAYPELEHERSLYDQIVKELHSRGLLGTDQLHTMMSGNGVYQKRTTQMGDQFLQFISEPL